VCASAEDGGSRRRIHLGGPRTARSVTTTSILINNLWSVGVAGKLGRMWRPPILLAPSLPPADDPAVATILEGLSRATGASGCVLTLHLLPNGPSGSFRFGQPGSRSPLVVLLEATESFRGECRLYGAGGGPAASPAALESLRPVLEGALLARIERNTASHQIDILMQILGVTEEANLLMDAKGEILFANARGEDLLSLHTERPQAQLANDGGPAPLLSLIVAQMACLRESTERVRHHVVTLGDGARWRLEIVALSGLSSSGWSLVTLTPIRLPSPEQLRKRFAGCQISRREAEVLAHVLHGRKACEIAGQLGITEYTVKDHLKHAYAKLGVSSRGQLLSRLSGAVPTAP
jgi:DNA-binding CsgD family transcriptional regulator